VLQGHAVKELHDHERTPIFLADVVNGADVRMVQRRGCLGFTAEAGERLPVMGNVLGKEFEGDEAMQTGVFSFVHHAHAAAEPADDTVMRDRLADQLL
jgi:hypothetical protein